MTDGGGRGCSGGGLASRAVQMDIVVVVPALSQGKPSVLLIAPGVVVAFPVS